MTPVPAILATLTGLAGLSLVFGAWRRRDAGWRSRMVVVAGWLLLLVSAGFWVRLGGVEAGVTLALLVPSVLAWVLVLVNGQRRRARAEPAAARAIAGRSSWVRHLALFLLAVPLAGVAATLVSVALSLLLPWQPVNAMVLVLIVLPLLWGGLACWACAEPRLARPTLAALAGALVSAAVIYG